MRFELEWFEGKPLPLRLMFCPAVWTLKLYYLGADAGEASVICINLGINRLLGVWHQQMRLGIASPRNLKTRYDYPPAILQLADSPRAERGPIKCGSLERRLDGRVVTFRYPRAFEVAD